MNATPFIILAAGMLMAILVDRGMAVIRSVFDQVDYKGLVAKLQPPKRMLTLFTTQAERVQVRVSARLV